MGRITTFLFLLKLSLLGGCAGSTVVDYKVLLEVSYHSAENQLIAVKSLQTADSTRLPTRLNPYPLIHYQDEFISWYLDINSIGILFYYLKNDTNKPLTIHWDQALVSSKYRPSDQKMQNYGFSMADYRGNRPITQLLESGKETQIIVKFRNNELFDSGRLFNVRYEKGTTRLEHAGTGEWLLIKLPIQVNDERLVMHLKLTAKEASARISYF